ncbi:MAG: tetratricopeptide repeat protein [bacterium]|nr:tetratricopeptide repeat protein [bacterium]
MVHYKFILFLFLFVFPSFVNAQVYPDRVVDSLLRLGISSIVNQDYNAAQNMFIKLKKDYPEIPLGKIYLAVNKIAQAYDYAQEFDEDYILNNLEDAKDQAELLLEKDQSNIWYRYFYALAEGYISYFDAINGSWFSALSSGVNSISEFERILESDKKFFEAYIAIGTFEYWKSRKMEFMDWLPFTNDTKKIGIDRLIVAIDSSSYNTYLAINSLIWIYIDQKRFSDAIAVAEKALKQFPESRTFKWGLARAYEETDVSKSIDLYKDILNSYPSSLNGNYENTIVLKHLIAQQYAKKGDKANALKYCNEILAIKNLPKSVKNDLNERLERVRSLKNDLTK